MGLLLAACFSGAIEANVRFSKEIGRNGLKLPADTTSSRGAECREGIDSGEGS